MQAHIPIGFIEAAIAPTIVMQVIEIDLFWEAGHINLCEKTDCGEKPIVADGVPQALGARNERVNLLLFNILELINVLQEFISRYAWSK